MTELRAPEVRCEKSVMQTPKISCLIVDDDPSILEMFLSAKQTAQVDIHTVETAIGLQSTDASKYELIFLDLLMPGVDGIEFLRTIESARPMPSVILMSGLSGRTLTSARQLGLSKGLRIFDTIRKPFRQSELAALLDRFVSTTRGANTSYKNKAELPRLTQEDLARALTRDEIVVHFQPQITVTDGAWIGVESLARWQHPEHGLLFPDSFISLAENPEVSGEFTQRIVEASLRALLQIEEKTGFSGTVSVNVAPSALVDYGFADRLIQVVDAHRIEHQRLIVEITESSVPKDLGMSVDIEMRLGMRGIKLSIDDFGTGYSSLERLKTSPFDELKIDLIFVRDSQNNPASRSIVQNSIALGHGLGMQVVAEGVENAEILAWLGTMGCDIAQGYYISKPLAIEDLCRWAAGRRGLL